MIQQSPNFDLLRDMHGAQNSQLRCHSGVYDLDRRVSNDQRARESKMKQAKIEEQEKEKEIKVDRLVKLDEQKETWLKNDVDENQQRFEAQANTLEEGLEEIARKKSEAEKMEFV